MNVFFSPFQNPFINLAIEDYFLRSGVGLPLVLFYVNRPCVVMGRFQNPWVECNLSYLAKSDIWLVRRQSGGGCVFHDEGNLNYCFIYPEAMIDRRRGVEIIRKAFKRASIDLEISPRYDLWLEGKKISGSAFKQTKFGSFHHGTFLVSSDLNRLEEGLKHTIIPKESKSIASVRSKVIKLEDMFPGVQLRDIVELISHELNSGIVELDGSLLAHPHVQQSFEQLISWPWLWGETPAFELEDGIRVHKGQLQGPKQGRFDRETMGQFYSAEKLAKHFPDFEAQEKSQRLVF